MEEALITAIVFGFAFAVVKLLVDYKKEKAQVHSADAGGSSLTTSELRQLVRQAVEEVMDERLGPLEKRLEKFGEPKLIPAGRSEETELEQPPSPPVARDRETTQ